MDPAFFFRYPGACDAESPEGNHPDGRIHESIVFHSEAAGMGSGGLCKETHREKAEILTETGGNGRIIGLIAAYLNREESGFISMLVVNPRYRRLGVAESLCRRVHQMARTREILQMRGEIREENLTCQMLARKLGYRKEKNGEWRILLSKDS